MQFNLEYIISLIFAFLAIYGVNKANPNLHPGITYFLIPLLIAYITIAIINNIFPSINKFGYQVYSYSQDNTLGMINDMNYIQIFPPILIILIIFILLLYGRIIK